MKGVRSEVRLKKGEDESSDEEIKYGNEDETEREFWKKSEEALAQIAEKIPHWYKDYKIS